MALGGGTRGHPRGRITSRRLAWPRPYLRGHVLRATAAEVSATAKTEAAAAAAASRPVHGIWPRGSLAAVVLGGGEVDSCRLLPLTMHRTLPAIPFGGSYRIIDLILSNLLNTGVNKVHILTAYNSYSLNRHLQRTYDLSSGVPYGGDGYLEVVAASQSPTSQAWVTGTAGCVRQFMSGFDSNSKNKFIEDVMVLPGDQVYAADFTAAIAQHRASGADLTILCRPVSGQQAASVGVVKVDGTSRIRAFAEKPPPEELAALAASDHELSAFLATASHGGAAAAQQQAAEPYIGSGGLNIGSTGIYIFRRHVLSELLSSQAHLADFGRQVIPEMIRQGLRVCAFHLPGYWADVGGSVGDYYAASMALLGEPPSIRFNTRSAAPFFRYPLTLPATQSYGSRLSRTLVSAGCVITESTISGSIVGARSIIGPNATVTDSVFMGADHYEAEKPQLRELSSEYPPLGIGEGSVLRRAILDTNARVGRGVVLVNKEGLRESYDRAVQGLYVRDGLVVVARDTAVPDRTVL